MIYTSEESPERRIPIPFDFDMSGLVNAKYAAPPGHLPIRLVRTRFYRGLCQPDDVMEDAVAHLLAKKEEILGLYETLPELSRLSRNRSVAYVKKYFAILEDEDKLRTQVYERCRGQDRLDAILAGEEPVHDTVVRD